MASSVLLAALLAAPAAAMVGTALCNPADPMQAFAYDAAQRHITLAGNTQQCLMVADGCCDGELIRGGSYLELQPCAPNFESQMLSWPGAASNYLLRPLSAAGEPTVSSLPSNATLVFDARGLYFGGVPVLGGPYSAVRSHLYATPAGALVFNSTGLCLTAALVTPASVGQKLNLQPCAPNKQLPGNGAPSSQLFSFAASGQVLTSEGLCVTAERVLGDDGSGSGSGSAALVSAACTVAPGAAAHAAQAFALSAGGRLTAVALPGAPAADAGAAGWWGARVPLTPAASATPGGLFSLLPVGGGGSANASQGALLHTQSGLCLDSAGVPEGQGCLDAAVRGLPFCDPALALEARVSDLLARLTLDEAVGMLGDDGDNNSPCGTHTAAVPRLDVSQYRWLVEVSSMAGSSDSCSALQPWHSGCPTSFPAAMLLTGAFNRSLWQLHGDVVGREMRALSALLTTQPALSAGKMSLAGHGPDINNPRDPRNGRNGELSSEDPFLSGEFAAAYVQGMQFGPHVTPSVNATHRMLASLKHFTAYSIETGRMGSHGNVSVFDLWDTYLPQYRRAMVDSFAAGTMCSYFSMRVEGAPGLTYVPSCANPYLLTTVVREFWGRADATHLSDCGAVWNMCIPSPRGNFFANGSQPLAAAVALNAGMDQNSNTISPSHLWLALAGGLTTPAAVYASAARVLAQRFRLGHFTPLEALPAEWLAPPAEALGSAANRAAASEGVRQGAVLLRNRGGVLPLRAGARLLVTGPTADSVTAAIGDMYGPASALCPDDSSDCWPTLGAALAQENAGGQTTVLPGIAMLANDTAGWGPAVAAAGSAALDAIVLALGTDRSVAGEGSDRADIGLPGVQLQFALAVLAAAARAGTPVVLVLVHNLPVSIDALLEGGSGGGVAAVVDAWAPTTHCSALAELLFGRSTGGWGRSVLTVYPAAYAQAVALLDMGFPATPASAGRGYRYYDGRAGAPLVRFGEGLSGYSTFSLSCAVGGGGGGGGGGGVPAGGSVAVNCTVTHTGGPGGDEVLLVMHRPGPDVVARVGGAHPLPLAALRDFQRVSVGAGFAGSVAFALSVNASLAYTNEVGAQVLYPGTHYVDVWNGNTENVTLAVEVTGDAAVTISAPPLPY